MRKECNIIENFIPSLNEIVFIAGDLKNEDAILEWMLVQKDPANEAIAEQSGENLKTFIENTEAVAIYLCELTYSILICIILSSF